MKTTKLLASIEVIVVVLALSSASNAGSLEPSAPPGPTMKTLDEVEPRIPIPGSSSATGSFEINNPGSYYLAGDRMCSGHGIVVNVDNVTIDLMGYQLIGPGPVLNYGVYMCAKNNVEIRNGTVRNFYRGIYEDDISGKNHRVINVRVMSNFQNGMTLLGNGHLVKDCTATENSASGIYAGSGSTVTGNTAYNNGNIGIYASSGCTVIGNTAYDNNDDGICAGYGCTVSGNTCYDNVDAGIYADSGCTVTGNTCRDNDHYGIWVTTYCLVDQNTAYGNSVGNMHTETGCVLGVNCAP